MTQINVYDVLSNTMWCTDKCKITTGDTAVTYQVYATALGSAPAVGNIYSESPSVDSNSTKQIYVGVGNYITITGSGYTALQLGTQSSAQAGTGNFVENTQVLTSISATSPQEIAISDGLTPINSMSITPSTGTFQTDFSAEFGLISVPIPDITAQGTDDVFNLAIVLADLPGVAHPLIFGLGEVLLPGVYDVSGAASIGGVLTLDAQNDPDAIFVIKCDGALNSGAASQVVLANGANPANIFWRADGAVALGAASIFYGTAVAVAGAASLGASSYMFGRLLSTAGAVSVDGAQPLTIPSDPSPISIPLGVLETFAMFSAAGLVSSSGVSVITGDVGTNQGPLAGFGPPTTLNGIEYPVGSPGQGSSVDAEFGIYVDDILISSSSVTSNVSITTDTVNLSTTAMVLPGQIITAKALVNLGQLTINNRVLSISGQGCSS